MKIAVSRPIIGAFDVPDVDGAEIVVGHHAGFASRDAALEFFRGAHALVSWVTERVDDEFLEAAGEQLRVVANYAVGYDNIDVPACRARGVIVTNTPDAVTDGTADVAVLLMLAAARRLYEGGSHVRSGRLTEQGVVGPDDFIGQPVSDQTLLIVGAGRIGYATAMRMTGWNMRVLYHSRSRKPDFESAPLNAEWVELDEGLSRADFVSVHTPLSDETRHQIDARRLALMKPSAVLVNTARGPIVDEAALVEALRAQKIFAAGLDVYEHEPKVHPGLVELDNAILLPHIGSANRRSREAMTALCAANINAVLSGKPPVTPVS